MVDREMTLEEFLGRLYPGHRAWKELNQFKQQIETLKGELEEARGFKEMWEISQDAHKITRQQRDTYRSALEKIRDYTAPENMSCDVPPEIMIASIYATSDQVLRANQTKETNLPSKEKKPKGFYDRCKLRELLSGRRELTPEQKEQRQKYKDWLAGASKISAEDLNLVLDARQPTKQKECKECGGSEEVETKVVSNRGVEMKKYPCPFCQEEREHPWAGTFSNEIDPKVRKELQEAAAKVKKQDPTCQENKPECDVCEGTGIDPGPQMAVELCEECRAARAAATYWSACEECERKLMAAISPCPKCNPQE
jgi:hypothetical protein